MSAHNYIKNNRSSHLQNYDLKCNARSQKFYMNVVKVTPIKEENSVILTSTLCIYLGLLRGENSQPTHECKLLAYVELQGKKVYCNVNSIETEGNMVKIYEDFY